VAKRVPANSLVDAQPSRNRKDMVPHDLLGHVRPASPGNRTSEHPIFWRFVTRLAMPLPQCLNQIIVSRNGFLRAFRLTEANNVLND